MSKNLLPAHIRQLVDKNNFVIAIKTLAQEQNISLEQAKTLIDDYEASKQIVSQKPVSNNSAVTSQTGFDSLTQGLDTHLKQENIKLPLIPYWVKRVAIILLVIGLLGLIIWKNFG